MPAEINRYVRYGKIYDSIPALLMVMRNKNYGFIALRHQHEMNRGGTITRYRPMLYAANGALGSLPSVALSSPVAKVLYQYVTVVEMRNL